MFVYEHLQFNVWDTLWSCLRRRRPMVTALVQTEGEFYRYYDKESTTTGQETVNARIGRNDEQREFF